MEDKYPCMHVECNEDAVYGVGFDDEIGSGTTVCEIHLQQILHNQEHYKYIHHYKLEDL